MRRGDAGGPGSSAGGAESRRCAGVRRGSLFWSSATGPPSLSHHLFPPFPSGSISISLSPLAFGKLYLRFPSPCIPASEFLSDRLSQGGPAWHSPQPLREERDERGGRARQGAPRCPCPRRRKRTFLRPERTGSFQTTAGPDSEAPEKVEPLGGEGRGGQGEGQPLPWGECGTRRGPGSTQSQDEVLVASCLKSPPP